MMAMTLAKIGRSMKNLDMRPDSYVLNIEKASVHASYAECVNPAASAAHDSKLSPISLR